jgi:HlyD family secretion protein
MARSGDGVRWGRWAIIAVAAAAIGGAAVQSLLDARGVRAAEARRGAISAYIEERAKTRLPETTIIATPFEGRVLPVTLDAGDPVRAGQIVARMEEAEVRSRLEAARATIERLEAEIVRNDDARLERTAIGQVERLLVSLDRTVEAAEERTRGAQARLDFLEQRLARVEESFEAEAVTEIERDEAIVDRVEADVEQRTSVLTLRATQAIRAATQLTIRFINELIEKKTLTTDVLRRQLDETRADLTAIEADAALLELRSPVDGVVLERFVSSYRRLAPGEPLLEIGEPERLEVEIEALTEDATRVRIGDTVEVFGEALRGPAVEARVTRIYPAGFEKVSSLGVEQQRVLVIAALTDEAKRMLAERGVSLGPQFRVRTRIITARAQEAIVAPRAALFRSERDQWRLFVIRDGRARLVDVEVGLMNDLEAQIRSGLEAGERVVLAPDSDLDDGDRVEVIED